MLIDSVTVLFTFLVSLVPPGNMLQGSLQLLLLERSTVLKIFLIFLVQIPNPLFGIIFNRCFLLMAFYCLPDCLYLLAVLALRNSLGFPNILFHESFLLTLNSLYVLLTLFVVFADSYLLPLLSDLPLVFYFMELRPFLRLFCVQGWHTKLNLGCFC